jgi:spore germination protein YaaH
MRRITAALALLTLALAAAPADGATARRKPSSCAGRTPTALLVVPNADANKVRVSWRRPKRLRGALRYRVLRDGVVVGQTRRRAMTVKVRGTKGFRLAVRPVLPSGRVLKCAATARRTLAHDAPTTPADLAASDVSETGATLTWSPARARTGALAGYRVLRDGATVKQVAGTSLTVALAPRRNYTFTVVAVDRAGYASVPSLPVRIASGHAAPTAPTGLNATDVTASGFTLHWNASGVRTGRITGYRVFRDGVTVGQTTATSMAVAGVGASEQHDMTVRAIDNLGYLSDHSAPLTVGTTPPPQTTGDVHAFLLASTGQSFADLRAHYMQIGTVYPTYFECGADGAIGGRDDPLVTRWSRIRGIDVLPRIDCQRTDRIHAILTDPAVRAAWLDGLTALVATNGYAGVNIDFEGSLPDDRAAYTSFVAELADRLHAAGKKLSLAVSPKTKETLTGRPALFDFPALSQLADTIFVMTWGKHWSTSAPGPLADIAWVTSVVDYVASMPNKGRFVIGAGLYGFDWTSPGGSGNPGTPLEWTDIQNLIAGVGATPYYDPVSLAPSFHYTDENGAWHEVWYTDARSLGAQLQLTRDRGLGVGFWRLGSEDQQIWAHPAIAG